MKKLFMVISFMTMSYQSIASSNNSEVFGSVILSQTTLENGAEETIKELNIGMMKMQLIDFKDGFVAKYHQAGNLPEYLLNINRTKASREHEKHLREKASEATSLATAITNLEIFEEKAALQTGLITKCSWQNCGPYREFDEDEK